VPLAAVMIVSQGAGLVGIAIVVALSGAEAPPVADLWPAAGAGAAGALALTAFYRALAIGTMSIVAPISATGAAVPVVVGLATGDRPGALVLAGMAIAVAGVILASREAPGEEAGDRSGRRSILLALVAALGFGTFFVGMDSAADADVFWALLWARAAAVTLLLAGAAIVRPPLRVDRPSAAILCGVGALDLAANALFALATTEGLLSLVAVLGSLYPVVTVLLARAVLHERVQMLQGVGVGAALAGVLLIAGAQ